MGIEIVLQDESCNQISEVTHDPDGVITQLLPGPADDACICARFIDPYGDTIFNHLQARVLLQEWDSLRHSFSEHSADTLWADTRKLIARCAEEPHVYIRFVGD
jgi:hypothetical protein